MTKRIWIITGERSGEAYGAELAKALCKHAEEPLELAGMGAEKMAAAGVDCFASSDALNVMGIWEVLLILPRILRTMHAIASKAKRDRPDLIVLIDNPGFNLRLAKKFHAMNLKVVWYISPKVWAWNSGRIRDLARCCEKVMCILPFEVGYFQNTELRDKAVFTGNPLLDMMKRKLDPAILREKNTLLILPGSRKSELKYIFPRMLVPLNRLKTDYRPELRYIIAATDARKAAFLARQIEHFNAVHKTNLQAEIVVNQTLEWMQRAETGFAASGTVTLECAIAGLPLVSIYATGPITFFIFEHLIKVRFFRHLFTLPNIILNKCMYEEYLQYCLHPYVLVPALLRILPGGERRESVMKDMKEVLERLSAGSAGAIDTAAKTVLGLLDKKQ